VKYEQNRIKKVNKNEENEELHCEKLLKQICKEKEKAK
jgi:hypothetical protein